MRFLNGSRLQTQSATNPLYTGMTDCIKKTVKWYLEHRDWWMGIISGDYQTYYERMYDKRAILEYAKI